MLFLCYDIVNGYHLVRALLSLPIYLTQLPPSFSVDMSPSTSQLIVLCAVLAVACGYDEALSSNLALAPTGLGFSNRLFRSPLNQGLGVNQYYNRFLDGSYSRIFDGVGYDPVYSRSFNPVFNPGFNGIFSRGFNGIHNPIISRGLNGIYSRGFNGIFNRGFNRGIFNRGFNRFYNPIFSRSFNGLHSRGFSDIQDFDGVGLSSLDSTLSQSPFSQDISGFSDQVPDNSLLSQPGLLGDKSRGNTDSRIAYISVGKGNKNVNIHKSVNSINNNNSQGY